MEGLEPTGRTDAEVEVNAFTTCSEQQIIGKDTDPQEILKSGREVDEQDNVKFG